MVKHIIRKIQIMIVKPDRHNTEIHELGNENL